MITRSLYRTFCTSARRCSATPEWQELIGGRAGIQRAKDEALSKYAEKVKERAAKEGMSVEKLMAIKAAAAAAQSKQRPPVAKPAPVPGGSEKVKRAASPQPAAGAKQDGVKPLSSILDLSKVSALTPTEVSTLWTSYHSLDPKNNQRRYLSASIPVPTYLRLLATAREFPHFVLPLARPTAEEESGVEMHYLQWALLPPPADAAPGTPPASSVIFTPLAEYQARQSYAQPYVILTHYPDLADSHGLVLMRGEVSQDVREAVLSDADAQVLAVRMQLAYNTVEGDGGKKGERRELLKTLNKDQAKFDFQKLVQWAYELE